MFINFTDLTEILIDSFIKMIDYSAVMTKTRLLLINPPFPRKVAGVPLQLLYLASAVQSAGFDVKLLDLDIEPDEQRGDILEQTITDYRPTHVGVTAYSPNYPESLDIMQNVKGVNPEITVISGGPHQIVTGDITQKPKCIDHVVTDTFGENRLLELLGSEKIISDRTVLFPAFELLKDSQQYQFDSDLFGNRKMTQILTATGCNQKCYFCSAPHKYDPFDSDSVVAQLKKLRELGYSALFFNDANFTNPSKGIEGDSSLLQIQGLAKQHGVSENYNRVISLMHALIAAGMGQEMIWGCQTKASMVNPLVLDWMAKAGCRYITYALETVDESALRGMAKGIRVSHVDNAIKLSRERGIKTGLYVMFGCDQNRERKNFDEERDLENVKRTLDKVEQLKPDYLSISVLADYPMFDRVTGQRKNTHLDYANKRYSREPIWLKFDEGWGAYHPNTTVEQAQRYLNELESRKSLKPHIWDANIPGAIRRF